MKGNARRTRVTGGSEALAALEKAKLDGDVEYIVAALQDVATRGLAAKYAAQFGADQAVPQLRKMLKANDPYVPSAAASALGKGRRGQVLHSSTWEAGSGLALQHSG